MTKTVKLYGSRSHCCGESSLIVRSRSGGFVSQNCEACGKPRKIRQRELPVLICNTCRSELTTARDGRGNYIYSCQHCNQQYRLADYVPHWRSHFKRNGLAIENKLANVY